LHILFALLLPFLQLCECTFTFSLRFEISLDPWVRQDIIVGQSLVGVDDKKFFDEVFTCIGYVVFPDVASHVEITFFDHLEQFEVVLVEEWGLTTKHDEHNYTQGPVVYAVVVFFVIQNFGRAVSWCSASGRRKNGLFRTDITSKSEVRNLDSSFVEIFVGKQKVLRLQIAMYNSKFVSCNNSVEKRGHDFVSFSLIKVTLCDNHIE
jgi:hypothetical protein